MKMSFEYYRVPTTIRVPRKGQPSSRLLYRYRRGEGFTEITNEPRSKGGLTLCTITCGDQAITAVAACSHSDNFCYKLGRDISLGRAMKLYEQEAT